MHDPIKVRYIDNDDLKLYEATMEETSRVEITKEDSVKEILLNNGIDDETATLTTASLKEGGYINQDVI